jgi:hypothetical protein
VGEDGFGGVQSDLPAIDVKGGHDLDILRFVRANPAMHQTHVRRTVARRAAVKIDPLQERTETIPHPNHGNSDFVHCRKTPRLLVAALPGQEGCHNIAIFAERNLRVAPARKAGRSRPFPS